MESEQVTEPVEAAPAGHAAAAAPSAAMGIRGRGRLDPDTVRVLQRSVGNRGMRKLLSRGPLAVARAPTGTEFVVAQAAQEAAAPLLSSMKIDSAGAAALFRGEVVVGEVVNAGKTGTIVF